MVWVLFALLAAFFRSLVDVFGKKSVQHLDAYVVAWAWRFFSLPFLLALLFIIDIPTLGEWFWLALVAHGLLSALTTILYIKAIQASDLSLTIPILSFTPGFLLITSPIMLGEVISLMGIAGVLLIVMGSYLLNFKERRNGFFGPFKALFRERGPRLMLVVAVLWSIQGNIDKIGLLNSSTLFWPIATYVFITIILSGVLLYRRKTGIRAGLERGKLMDLIPLGAFSAFSIIFHMLAISLTLVPYVVSVKRTSTLMSVLYGYFIFKEHGIRERLLGASIMVVGVAIIAFT